MEVLSPVLGATLSRQMSPEVFWGMFFVFALGFVWLVQYQYRRIGRGVLVQGKVIKMQVEKFGNGSAVFPVFEILEGEYKGVECSSSIASNPPVVAVGEEHPVYYDPVKGVIFSRKAAQYLMALSAVIAIFGMGILWLMGMGMR